MEKFIIKKELSRIDIEKIRQFTEIELSNMSDNKRPLCYQIGINTIIIGKFKICKLHDTCWRVNKDTNIISDFYNRKDAIIYCLAIQKQKYSLASNIILLDTQLGNLESKAKLCRYQYKHALQTDDSWNVVLYSNKYSELVSKINNIKVKLKNDISVAKHSLLQEN